MRRTRYTSMLLMATSLTFLTSCGGGGGSVASFGPPPSTVVGEWTQQALDAIISLKTSPPVNSRSLAVVHTAIYDAWTAYDARALAVHSGGTLRRPAAERTEANKRVAISFAAYRALVDQWPAAKPAFDAKMAELGLDPANVTTDLTTPAGVGNVAATNVLAFRHADGSNQLGNLAAGRFADYTGYAPVNTPDVVTDPGRWQPLRFSDGQGGTITPGFVTPHWGRVTPFAVTNGEALRPPAPAPVGSNAYREQALELVDLQATIGDREKVIAEYWADGPRSVTPPGHWIVFAQYVSQRDQHTIDQDVKLFFLVSNAVMDAGICCWEAKRHYDYARPITAIRYLFAGTQIMGWPGPGQQVRLMDGSQWKPYQPDTFITPPFAEYTSGHSTFSAASAEVLKEFTGSDSFGASVTIMPGQSAAEPGFSPTVPITLQWPTFSAAADEAGMSRRYGGIHFKQGDLEARAMGRVVGQLVWQKAQNLFNGVPTP